MKRFKNVVTAAVSLLICMVMIAGCRSGGAGLVREATDEIGPHGIRYAADQTLRGVYSTEVTNWSTFNSPGIVANWTHIAQFNEGLLGLDRYDNIVPALAESWTVSEDGLVYTFQLRQGVYYIDHNLEKVTEMKADDFVAVAEFVLNPENARIHHNWGGVIAGAAAIYAGETDDFSTLGFKALSDYVLEITLEAPLFYWLNMASTYVPFPREFVEGWGYQNGIDHTKILSVGPYVLTDFVPQVRHVFVKNPYYWDIDNVHILRIENTFNAEANINAPEMFRRGETDWARIDTGIIDLWMTSPELRDFVISYPVDWEYPTYYAFNYDPRFPERYNIQNYLLAIDNMAFRQSLYWGLDRLRASKAYDPYPSSELSLTHIVTGADWMIDANGKMMKDYPQFANLLSRPNWAFDPVKAIAYRDQAIAELTAQGATFPVQLYMRFNPNSMGWPQEIEIVTQQLSDLFGPGYIDFVVEAGPAVGFLAEVRRTGDWGFMKLNHGISRSVPDPGYASTNPFNELHTNTWTFLQNATSETLPNVRALHDHYVDLLNIARNIIPLAGTPTFNDDVSARFAAFAEAEAFLIENALIIPFHYWYEGFYVTRTFDHDSMGSSRKGQKILAEPLTAEQYNLLYADWLEAKRGFGN
jgi:oligopeptide transport system substrate-binding protein